VRRLAILATSVFVLAGCGGEDESSPATSGTTTGTTTQARPAAEQFGYIRSVSTAGPAATLAFDDAEFLTGEEAQRAAEEDGEIPPGEPIPNDYYIRNPDKTTQTLPVATDAKITARRCPLCRKGRPGDLEDFLGSFMKTGQTFADPYRGAESQYWLTIEDGAVVAIDEQYLP
jgi:ABC-type glycerol-3-phosphate transport system substrate-binding protein